MNFALILAGGRGVRFNSKIPKQFVEVNGKPIIIYTLEKFERHPNVDSIVIACNNDYIDYMKELINKYQLKKVCSVCSGGDTFQKSVCNGVFEIHKQRHDYDNDNDMVMIHMSVSPFLGDDIITDGYKVCKKYGNSISEYTCLCCMAKKDDEVSTSQGVLRETLAGLNTPQTFKLGEIYDAYVKSINEGFLEDLEPHTTSLMFELGKKLYFSKGSQYNLKITTKEDMDLFEGYIMLQEKRAKENS